MKRGGTAEVKSFVLEDEGLFDSLPTDLSMETSVDREIFRRAS
ncbi:MAG: hypothetical protein P8Z41_16100 [Anaerolineales bacterium]